METLSLGLFFAGVAFLLGLGLLTALVGISADSAQEFPFQGVGWLRPATVAALLAVAQAWFYIAPSLLGGAALATVFILAAAVVAIPLFRGGA